VYPSKYEGFGLPVVEAMKCGCPVITCPNASIPEVGGDAVFYIPDDDINAMGEALVEVQKPSLRQNLIEAGDQQAKKFTWGAMAAQIKTVLLQQANNQTASQQILVLLDWHQAEAQLQTDFEELFRILCGTDPADSYEFLVETTGIMMENADAIMSGGFMNFLMEQESELNEPNIRLIEPLTAHNLTDHKFNAKICRHRNIPDFLKDIPEFDAKLTTLTNIVTTEPRSSHTLHQETLQEL
jgi:hypothetical protein